MNPFRSKVAVVILNYNGEKFLNQFLPQVLACSQKYEVVVADNNSTDNSVEVLKNQFPSVRLIVLEENTGYAQGYNNALQQIESEYYMLLNSDVEVTDDWLEPLVAILDKNEKIVAVQPKIKAYHQKEKFEYAGASGGFIDSLGYPFCRGRFFDYCEEDTGQYDDFQYIDWTSGACMLIRSKEFHRAGGFDGSYFAHMEEIDLCWRLRNEGFLLAVVPQSVVYHVGGGTLNYNHPRKTLLNFRNSLCTLYKNELSAWRLFKVFMRLVLDGVAGVQFLTKGEVPHILAIIRSHFHFYRSIPDLNKKRNLILQNMKALKSVSIPRQSKTVSVVWNYFILKKKTFNQL